MTEPHEHPSQILRAAAATIRANAAGVTPGPWDVSVDQDRHDAPVEVADYHGNLIATTGTAPDRRAIVHARHLALWRPEAARAVADLLDALADAVPQDPLHDPPCRSCTAALVAARAVLYPEPIAGEAYASGSGDDG